VSEWLSSASFQLLS